MAYIGNIPAEAYTNTVKDSFNGTGSATAFTLSQPTVTNDVRVVVENVVQDPTVAYSVSGTTLTFTSAPPSGTANIYVVHLGAAVMTAIPPSEIADATTFASSVTVQGAFTSQGIDDNGNATAITIDASENVLVGTTNVNIRDDTTGTGGINLRSDSILAAARNGGEPLLLNRLGTDGELIKFNKDGSTVGSIGTANARLSIGGTDTGIMFKDSADNVIPWNTGSNGSRDGAISLGEGGGRFKDLYLSGGVFLGGTGVDNHLHDYEEGLFTVSLALGTGSASLTSNKLFYTKVGRCVTVSGIIRVNGVSSPSGSLGFNVPFACQAPGTGEDNPRATVQTNIVETGNNNEVMLELLEGAVLVSLFKSGTASLGNAGNILKANTTLGINFSYFTST